MIQILIICTCVVDIMGFALTQLPESMLNIRLDSSNPITIDNTSLGKCVRTCEFVTQCLSFNYSVKTRRCQLFNKTKNDSIPLVYRSGEIHATMEEWLQIARSQCTSKPCPYHIFCLPNSDSHVCSQPMDIPQTTDSDAPSSNDAATTQGTDTATDGNGTVGSQTGGSNPMTSTPLPSDGQTSTEGTASQGESQADGSNPLTTGDQASETSTLRPSTEGPCSTFVMSDIAAENLAASSVKGNESLSSDFYGPQWARLNTVTNGTYHGGGWMAATNDQSQYIEVRFNQISRVYALLLQGYEGMEAWVTEFKVLYSTDCDSFSYKLLFGSHEVFTGPYSSDQTVMNVIYNPVDARCFRVNPVTWYNNIGLRLDILACEVPKR